MEEIARMISIILAGIIGGITNGYKFFNAYWLASYLLPNHAPILYAIVTVSRLSVIR